MALTAQDLISQYATGWSPTQQQQDYWNNQITTLGSDAALQKFLNPTDPNAARLKYVNNDPDAYQAITGIDMSSIANHALKGYNQVTGSNLTAQEYQQLVNPNTASQYTYTADNKVAPSVGLTAYNHTQPTTTPTQTTPTPTQPQMPDWASQPPAWLNEMQSWWQGMQQQQQAPASYTSQAFPQYTPNYGNNALMRPVTQGSNITAQNQYGNMGYNNKRSSLWGDW
jgi:hypothetical protein